MLKNVSRISQIPETLIIETRHYCIAGFILLLVFSILFKSFWLSGQSLMWLLQAGLLWLVICFIVFKLLHLNRNEEDSGIYPNMGWANRLTVFRGFLIAITGGFIFQPQLNEKILLIPAVSYLVAAVIDRVDGYIARKTRHESKLGNKLDIELDALGLLIAPLLAVWTGQIHWSYLSVSLAYYCFQWGIYWRTKQGKPVFQLDQNMSRRSVAGFQMGFLAVVLWPILAPPATTVAGFAFMLPLLFGFIIDWCTISGQLKRGSDLDNFLLRLSGWLQVILLPALRVLVTVLLVFCLHRISSSDGQGDQLTSPGTLVLFISLGVSAWLILLGILGRLFAVILSCLLCWLFLGINMTISDGVLLVAVIWIMQLGTGKYSCWQWDESWVNRYDGA